MYFSQSKTSGRNVPDKQYVIIIIKPLTSFGRKNNILRRCVFS